LDDTVNMYGVYCVCILSLNQVW